MTKQRLDGLYLLLLGTAVGMLLGGVLLSIAPAKMSDFKAIYYGACCLIHHSDPYQSSQILREFEANGEKLDQPYSKSRHKSFASAEFTDPWGTSIELTEGLNRF